MVTLVSAVLALVLEGLVPAAVCLFVVVLVELPSAMSSATCLFGGDGIAGLPWQLVGAVVSWPMLVLLLPLACL